MPGTGWSLPELAVATGLDGLLTSYSWHHAMRAEKVLRDGAFAVELLWQTAARSGNTSEPARGLWDP